MNTQNKRNTLRNTASAASLALGMTLLVAFAGAQEVTGGANQDGRTYKGAMREMPGIKEAGIVTVRGDENWDEMLGFGKDSDMAEMMTLMMVGGSGMEHMKMAAMKPGMKMDKSGMKGMAMEPQGLPVTVTLAQNPPAVGENTLDVLVTDASGKPVTGLKLMAVVAMTSMDMGTERPKPVEGKGGHYSVPVKFSMKGPWRVMVMNDGKADKTRAVHTALNFNVDGKTKWKMLTAQDAARPVMPGMAMPDEKMKDAPGAAAAKMPDMATSDKPNPDSAPQKSDAPAATGPTPPKTEAADNKTPAKTAEASGALDTKKPAPDKTAPAPTPGYQMVLNTPVKSLKVGKNMLDVTVLDPAGKPVTGAKVTASVEMTSMDMGVTKPKAQEGKAGHYLSEVTFSMKGPWRVTMTVTPPKQKPFTKALDFNVPK